MKQADKYLKTVEWSKEDSCYIGTCPGLINGGIHGSNEAKVYEAVSYTHLTLPTILRV